MPRLLRDCYLFFPVFLLITLLIAAPLVFPSFSHAADLYILGGGGGAGRGGDPSDSGGGGAGGYIGNVDPGGAGGNADGGGNSGGQGGTTGAGNGVTTSTSAGAAGFGGGGNGGKSEPEAQQSDDGDSSNGAAGGAKGGQSGSGGGGGGAGKVATSGESWTNLFVKGGGGGASTSNGPAGDGRGGGGGAALLNGGGYDFTVTNNVTVAGGDGGASTVNKGGAGGAATVNVNKLTVGTGTLQVTSGATLDGTGGAANFTANTLIAPTINVVKKDGALTFSVGFLDVGGNDTALIATNTSAANFAISTANLSGGHLLSIDNSAGALNIGALNVTGSGKLYVASGGQQAITTLNAQNADLTFVLPAGVVAGQTIVKVNSANLDGATIGVDDGNGRINLAVGQSVTLVGAATSLTANGVNLTVRTANGDLFAIQVSGNDLQLILQQLSPNTPSYQRLKAFAEGRAGGMAFVNQGADMLMGQGFGSALTATAGSGARFGTFGGFGGGSSRYNTGSHVDVDSTSLLAGLAWGNDVGNGSLGGRMTLGAFFEAGWGNYDSHNSFSNAASVKGNGDTNYYGGGILGRYDFTQGALSGFYLDTSARLGRAETDFSTNDITYQGRKTNFETSSMYYGLHGGLGYQWDMSEKAMLDLSGKLLWTRQQGDNVNVHGDDVRFKDADSLRTRLGGRFNYAITELFTPYAGAYWEHEFDGKAKSTVNGNRIDSPTLQGNTGVGELGVSFKPMKNSGFALDLGVQGYTGVREGVSGSFQLKYEF